MLFKKKIILGSKSPRRKELLQHICSTVEIRTQDVEEIFPDTLALKDVPVYLSELKATALLPTLLLNEILITADTVVILDDKILGKPMDKVDAFLILKNLSGNKHIVVSGCTIQTKNKKIQISEITEVYFKHLSEKDITFYIEQFQPFDKAGAYGIQEWIGMIGIEKINGCYYNVMGLPLSRIYQELQNF
jgi:septum formation protein